MKVMQFALTIISLVCVSSCDLENGIASKESVEQTQSRDAEKEKNELDDLITVTSADLALAYDQNSIAADQTYKGKRFKVTGVITDISTDLSGDGYIALSGTDEFSKPRFYFDDKAMIQLAALHKGEAITLACTGQGNVIDASISDACQIIPPIATPNKPTSPSPENNQPNPTAQLSGAQYSPLLKPDGRSLFGGECFQGECPWYRILAVEKVKDFESELDLKVTLSNGSSEYPEDFSKPPSNTQWYPPSIYNIRCSHTRPSVSEPSPGRDELLPLRLGTAEIGAPNIHLVNLYFTICHSSSDVDVNNNITKFKYNVTL